MIVNGTANLPQVAYVRDRLVYNAETGKLFWRRHGKSVQWDARWAGKEAFTTIGKNGYACGRLDWKAYYAHRVIWALHHGEWPGCQVDRINGVRHDNRISNLREVTQSQNNKNASLPSHNTSGHVGVAWCQRMAAWEAHIGLRVPEYLTQSGRLRTSRKMHLGYFTDLSDAVTARKEASQLHGFSDRHGQCALEVLQ